jgi:hypothetical protein
MIGSSSFYVPQVNRPGSMATFVTPASIPISAIGMNGGKTTALGALRVLRYGRRGLGQDDGTVDFGTPPDITTTPVDTLPAWITTPSGGPVNPSADVAEGGSYVPPPPSTQQVHIPSSSQQSGMPSWLSQLFRPAASTATPAMQMSLSMPASTAGMQNPLASLTGSSWMPILLIGGVMLVVAMAGKK